MDQLRVSWVICKGGLYFFVLGLRPFMVVDSRLFVEDQYIPLILQLVFSINIIVNFSKKKKLTPNRWD